MVIFVTRAVSIANIEKGVTSFGPRSDVAAPRGKKSVFLGQKAKKDWPT